ncbi:MAG: metallophosphoesterase [Terracidiphilus sp.]|nr:metallophosphoesterase [Terracidiphilus sp.]MDR3797813.1 metallophosphoesterase [Terracidiphilus sp.]
MKAWPALAICVIQVILFAAHWLVFSTFIAFVPGLDPAALTGLHAAMLVLAFSFVAASLLSFRFSNFAVRLVYWLAAVWLGFLNFYFWASLLAWIAWLVLKLTISPAYAASARPIVAGILYEGAALIGLYGLFNARVIRMRRIEVQLPNLPPSWRGRRGVLLSDLHLGPINGVQFCRRLVAKARSFQPDVVFVPGDLFDGTRGNLDRLVAPLKQLTPPLGIYFSTGNHEEFSDPTQYIDAITRAGIRVLGNELVTIDGVQVAGVFYHDSSSPLRMKAALDGMHLDRERPSILLNHAPTRLPTVEQAGFSLQLSGHTHGGQFLPFTWITQSVYGPFTKGLHRFGALQVYTSTGAGTWGPPLRAGTRPEIVFITFA